MFKIFKGLSTVITMNALPKGCDWNMEEARAFANSSLKLLDKRKERARKDWEKIQSMRGGK